MNKTYLGYGLASLVVIIAIIFLPWANIWLFLCMSIAWIGSLSVSAGLVLLGISFFMRWNGSSGYFGLITAIIKGLTKRPGCLGLPLFLFGLILSFLFQYC